MNPIETLAVVGTFVAAVVAIVLSLSPRRQAGISAGAAARSADAATRSADAAHRAVLAAEDAARSAAVSANADSKMLAHDEERMTVQRATWDREKRQQAKEDRERSVAQLRPYWDGNALVVTNRTGENAATTITIDPPTNVLDGSIGNANFRQDGRIHFSLLSTSESTVEIVWHAERVIVTRWRVIANPGMATPVELIEPDPW